MADLGGTGSGGESDVLVVSSGATANAAGIKSFTATSSTRNDGTANLTSGSGGSTINVSASVAGLYTLTGGSGIDNITGGSGNDIILGEAGNDIIVGGAGNDSITGGAGNDSFTGGTGNDTFNVNNGTDTITDLATGDILIITTGCTANATGITTATSLL